MLNPGFLSRGRSVAAFQVALVAIALAVLFVVQFTVAAAPPTATVWVADQKTLKQVDPSVNQFIRSLVLAQKADALNVDPSDGALWALSNKHLLKFASTGTPLLDLDLKRLYPGFPDPKHFTLDPYDGSLWVAGEKALLHLSPTGQKQGEGTTPDPIQAIGLDTDQTLWVLTEKQLLHMSAQGSLTNSLTLKPFLDDPKFLAVDGLGGVIWVGSEKRLLQFNLNTLTQPPLTATLPAGPPGGEFKIEVLGIHPVLGTLWAVGKDSLLRYDRNGFYLGSSDLTPYALGKIETLAFEPVSDSLWLGGKQALGRFTPSGAFVAKLPAEQGIDAIGIGPFTLRPTLALLAPVDNSVTNNPRPTIRLGLGASCSGSPCTLVDAYLNSLSLTTDLNGIAVGPFFTLLNGEASYTPTTRLPEGLNTLNATAKDIFGHSSDPVTGKFTIDTIPPRFLTLTPADGSTLTAATVIVSGQVDDPTASVMLRNAAGTVLNVGNATFSFSVTLAQGLNTFTLTAQDPAGNAATISLRLTYNAAPVLNPSPINPTVATVLSQATAFLYTGTNPVQTGVNPATIDPKRIAVVRGKVSDRHGVPLSTVNIRVLNHPEFGQTQSRADGLFDLAVNGGGALTVVYEKAGYLPAQRQVNAPWQDYVHADEVMLLPVDSKVTTVNLSLPTLQVAQGNVVTDSDGTRQATVFFPPGTTATMVKPDGTTQALTTLNVRATEYTVGPNGPKAMPAPLPPTSAYTYAVELSVDEALSVNAKTVVFNQAVPFYLDNFLNFPVGGNVPTGYYDRDKGIWIPSANGRVIKILSIGGGLANLDTNGDGVVDTAAQLAALGITDAERGQLASLYPAGKTLWRVPITHFTPWDCNWPFGPPPGAGPPGQPPPGGDTDGDGSDGGGDDGDGDGTCDDPGDGDGSTGDGYTGPYGPFTEGESYVPPPSPAPSTDAGSNGNGSGGGDSDGYYDDLGCGSIIKGRRQVLGERAAVTGTPFSLNYRSNRIPGRQASNSLSIPLSGATVPASLKRIELEINVAGRQFSYNFPASPNQKYDFTWDRLDAYGRTVQGSQPATIQVGYVYDAVYMPPAQVAQSFAEATASGTPLTGNRARNEITLWQPMKSSVGIWDARTQGVGAWTLDVHHAYDPSGQILHLGNGTLRSAKSSDDVISTVASATTAGLNFPLAVAVDSQGNLFIADSRNNRIRKVSPAGIITTVAGNGVPGFSGDGGPATAASLNYPYDVAVDPQGNLFIVDLNNNRIRKVSPAGIITTVAGNGVPGSIIVSGDGGPATAASIGYPYGVAVDSQGNLFIADSGNRIRKVSPAGIITTVAGSVNGTQGFSGDGGPATAATFYSPSGVAVDSQGNLFIADIGNNRIRKVSPAGIITTVAGRGGSGFSGDGGPATAARLNVPSGVAVDSQGNLFIADFSNSRIRKVSPAGIITTVAGNGARVFGGDGGPATAASFVAAIGVAVDSQGNLFIADYNNRIRKISHQFPSADGGAFFIASKNGTRLYEFDPAGRHLRTLNSLTGTVVYQFTYNANGYLTHVTDGDGNVTTIERSGDTPTAIIAPDGQRTALALDPNGYLAAITNPAGETTGMGYTPDGLLTHFTNARGHTSAITYDALGRLARDDNPAAGFWGMSRTETNQGFAVTVASALGRSTTHQVDRLPNGDIRRTRTFPDGNVHTRLFKPDGTRQALSPNGTLTTVVKGPDPRFGMQSPLATSKTVKLPSGLTASATRQRSVTLADPQNLLSLQTHTTAITANGKTTNSVYSAASRSRVTTSPVGRQATATFNTQGRPVQRQIAGLEAVNYVYDARGRLTTLTQGGGAETRTASVAYNPQGYIDRFTDPAGQTAHFSYDTAGRVTQQTLPDGRIITWSYDANGNVVGLTPPGRPQHTFSYTPVDLEERYTPPSAGLPVAHTQYTYNLDKQLTTATRPDGQIIAFGYDTAGRLSTITLPSRGIVLGYSADGQLASLNTSQGVNLSYTHDGFLPISETYSGPIAGAVTRTYNSDFRTTGIGVNGSAIAFGYDADNLLIQAGALGLARNAQNGLLTGTTLGATATIQGYNAFGELKDFQASHGGNAVYAYALTRDSRGNITQKTETVQGQTDTYGYSYDATGRLIEVTKNGAVQSNYIYDPNGNRLSAGAVYDDQDRLISQGTTTYTYTANGELKTKTQAGQTSSYTYDPMGNLIQASVPGANDIEYVIDGRNRRIGRRYGATLIQGFLYQDGLRLIAELDGSGTIVSRFVYGSRFNVPDYMIKGGTTYRIISDHLGSPRLIINTNTGAIEQRMDYDEYGNVTQDTNPGFQPFGFAGGLYDRDTKLTRFGARDYDAETGRWTAKDPIGFRGGDTNLFGYVLNDPVNLTDPSGLMGRGSGANAPKAPKDCTCKPSSPPPAPGEIIEGSVLGGMGLVGTAGGILGLGAGVAEAGHMGALGGVVIAEAVVGGAVAGAVIGAAAGMGVAGLVIGGIYLFWPDETSSCY